MTSRVCRKGGVRKKRRGVKVGKEKSMSEGYYTYYIEKIRMSQGRKGEEEKKSCFMSGVRIKKGKEKMKKKKKRRTVKA